MLVGAPSPGLIAIKNARPRLATALGSAMRVFHTASPSYAQILLSGRIEVHSMRGVNQM